MGHWDAERIAVSVMLQSNLPGWLIKEPNRRFQRPSPGNVSSPAKFIAWDLLTDSVEARGSKSGEGMRTRWIDGRISGLVAVQEDSGVDEITRLLDTLDALADAASASNWDWHPIEPGAYYESPEDASEGWYVREWELPYRRSSDIAVGDVVTLAGLGATSTAISTEAAHGLEVGDWVGLDVSGWRRVGAIAGEPRCEGVVSLVNSDTSFVLTAIGAVRIPGHGWEVGPLYLSQDSLGAGWQPINGPENGVARQVATVFDENNIIVLSLPEVEL